tara:strand:- start:693 stop:908 length:216 start_codon:yes stop_codon:yes gene_type:complete
MNKPTKEQEVMHDNFFEGLIGVSKRAEDLGSQHLIYFGLQFFIQMAVDNAPNEEEVDAIIEMAISSVDKKA